MYLHSKASLTKGGNPYLHFLVGFYKVLKADIKPRIKSMQEYVLSREFRVHLSKLPNKTLHSDENSVKSVFKHGRRADKGKVTWQWKTQEKTLEKNWQYININQSFAILADEISFF